MRLSLLIALLLATTVACGDDDGGGPAPDAAVSVDASGGGADATSFEYDQNGCLTFTSASQICGFNSDNSVCAFSHSCSAGDEDQCKINCEMGTTVKCYKMADVTCLQHAVAAHDCAALAACAWIL
jgi:hypothetical protein